MPPHMRNKQGFSGGQGDRSYAPRDFQRDSEYGLTEKNAWLVLLSLFTLNVDLDFQGTLPHFVLLKMILLLKL